MRPVSHIMHGGVSMDIVSLPFLIISAHIFVMFLKEVYECHFESQGYCLTLTKTETCCIERHAYVIWFWFSTCFIHQIPSLLRSFWFHSVWILHLGDNIRRILISRNMVWASSFSETISQPLLRDNPPSTYWQTPLMWDLQPLSGWPFSWIFIRETLDKNKIHFQLFVCIYSTTVFYVKAM